MPSVETTKNRLATRAASFRLLIGKLVQIRYIRARNYDDSISVDTCEYFIADASIRVF